MELRNWASISEGWVGREDGEELGSPSKFKFISKFKLTIRTREWHRGPYGILPMFATSAFISAFCQEEVYLLLQRERERERKGSRGSSLVFLLIPVSQIVPGCGHHYVLTVILRTSLNICLFLQKSGKAG